MSTTQKNQSDSIPCVRLGRVKFYDHNKGFGYIIDNVRGEFFFHGFNASGFLSDRDLVRYQLRECQFRGKKEYQCINVNAIPSNQKNAADLVDRVIFGPNDKYAIVKSVSSRNAVPSMEKDFLELITRQEVNDEMTNEIVALYAYLSWNGLSDHLNQTLEQIETSKRIIYTLWKEGLISRPSISFALIIWNELSKNSDSSLCSFLKDQCKFSAEEAVVFFNQLDSSYSSPLSKFDSWIEVREYYKIPESDDTLTAECIKEVRDQYTVSRLLHDESETVVSHACLKEVFSEKAFSSTCTTASLARKAITLLQISNSSLEDFISDCPIPDSYEKAFLYVSMLPAKSITFKIPYLSLPHRLNEELFSHYSVEEVAQKAEDKAYSFLWCFFDKEQLASVCNSIPRALTILDSINHDESMDTCLLEALPQKMSEIVLALQGKVSSSSLATYVKKHLHELTAEETISFAKTYQGKLGEESDHLFASLQQIYSNEQVIDELLSFNRQGVVPKSKIVSYITEILPKTSFDEEVLYNVASFLHPVPENEFSDDSYGRSLKQISLSREWLNNKKESQFDWVSNGGIFYCLSELEQVQFVRRVFYLHCIGKTVITSDSLERLIEKKKHINFYVYAAIKQVESVLQNKGLFSSRKLLECFKDVYLYSSIKNLSVVGRDLYDQCDGGCQIWLTLNKANPNWGNVTQSVEGDFVDYVIEETQNGGFTLRFTKNVTNYRETADFIKKSFPHPRYSNGCWYFATSLDEVLSFVFANAAILIRSDGLTIKGFNKIRKTRAGSRLSSLPIFCEGNHYISRRLGDRTAYWCLGSPCAKISIRDHDSEHYTLYDMLKIVGYEGLLDDNGYAKFLSYLNWIERCMTHMFCSHCGKLLLPIDVQTRSAAENELFGAHAVSHFHCISCDDENNKDVHLTHCFNKGCGETIDSRESKTCPKNFLICPSCGSCCGKSMFAKKDSIGLRVPSGEFHAEADMWFCYKCGSRLEYINGQLVCPNHIDVVHQTRRVYRLYSYK